jgi:DNA-binding transcriptional regulator YhcF (GntR family)
VDTTLSVDLADPTPPFEQLRRQLAYFIQTGRIRDGERLPPLRQLAGDLGLAVGTVARTYRELEAEGLVRSRRGGGTRVVAPATPPADVVRRHLDDAARAYVQQAARLGAEPDAVRRAVDDALSAAAQAEGIPAKRSASSSPSAAPRSPTASR